MSFNNTSALPQLPGVFPTSPKSRNTMPSAASTKVTISGPHSDDCEDSSEIMDYDDFEEVEHPHEFKINNNGDVAKITSTMVLSESDSDSDEDWGTVRKIMPAQDDWVAVRCKGKNNKDIVATSALSVDKPSGVPVAPTKVNKSATKSKLVLEQFATPEALESPATLPPKPKLSPIDLGAIEPIEAHNSMKLAPPRRNPATAAPVISAAMRERASLHEMSNQVRDGEDSKRATSKVLRMPDQPMSMGGYRVPVPLKRSGEKTFRDRITEMPTRREVMESYKAHMAIIEEKIAKSSFKTKNGQP